MVGSATAMHLSDAGVDVRVLCSGSSLPSSSNDVSRLIIGGDPAADASILGFREPERCSGVPFWHDAGLLAVVPAHSRSDDPQPSKAAQESQAVPVLPGVLWPTRLHCAPHGARAWLGGSTRLLPGDSCRGGASRSEMARRACRACGGCAGRLRRDHAQRRARVCGGGGARTRRVCAAQLGASEGLRRDASAHYPMWGKTVFHAWISETSAKNLAPMPPLWVWPINGVPEPTI